MQGVIAAFKHIAENKQEEKMLRAQFVTFHMKKGLYGLPPAQMDAVAVESIDR